MRLYLQEKEISESENPYLNDGTFRTYQEIVRQEAIDRDGLIQKSNLNYANESIPCRCTLFSPKEGGLVLFLLLHLGFASSHLQGLVDDSIGKGIEIGRQGAL